MIRRLIVLGAALAVGTLIACSDSSPTDPGPGGGTPELGAGAPQVSILLTDAPADYIDTALVGISRVYLKADEDSADVDLYNNPDSLLVFDLLTLQDGVTAHLASGVVPENDYKQLRMVVDSAMVSLVDSLEFEDGGNWDILKVPSGASSGIKVQLASPVPADSGFVTVITVDFDVNDNFKIQGNPNTPAGIKGVLFTPTLKEKGRSQDEQDDEEGEGEEQ